MNEYTFRWDADLSVLWVGERSYPAAFNRSSAQDYMPPESRFLELHPTYRMETRQASVHFENQWVLSTIWGDATYSTNRIQFTDFDQPFVEEPTHVEVGILVPDYRNEHGGGLWGDPLGYVSVAEYHRLADMVMMLPNDCELPEGEWEDVEGFCDFLVTAGLDRTL